MKILECSGLVKMYGKVKAVDGLSFSVEKGELLGLLGPNGAGKTTTIKMILGLTSLSGGKVIIDRDIKIGYSPETPYFHLFLTGYEVMRFYSQLQKLDRRTADRQIGRLLELTGLSGAAGKKLKTIQRACCRGLHLRRRCWENRSSSYLMNQLQGLDAVGRIEMLGLIERLKYEGKTIIINSHILSDIEKQRTGQ